MKILYVTGMAAPLKGILTGKTEKEINGLPGFFFPWYKLIKRGHQVDFVVISNFNEKHDIKVDWFKEENLIANVYDPYSENFGFFRIFRQAKRFLKLLYYTDKAIKKNHYDFIYCKAYEGVAGNILANWHKIPSGTRSFGTTLYPLLKNNGSFKTALKRPLEYVTFKIKKDFFLMTDDATHGDKVYEIWKPKKEKYQFLFWRTGVEIKNIEDIPVNIQIPDHPFLFFAARFDPWKRHDRIIKILHYLHESDIKAHLYFAGQQTSKSYFSQIEGLVEKYHLTDYVHFMGVVTQDEVKILAYHSMASIFMYDFANIGNVFFETFAVGSIVIGLDDGVLNEFISHELNGYLINDEKEATEAIKMLYNNPELQSSIRTEAIKTAREKFLTIDERFDKEVDLIEDIVNKRKQDK